MRFLDSAKVFIKSGDGGAGVCSFRREKYIEFGGPDGGNGGRGGDIIAIADASLNTLIDYRYQQHFKAGRGGHGMGKNRTGRSGANVELRLPVGTQILAEDGDTLILDLNKSDSHAVLARGGDGGFGNAHYKSSTERAPRRFTAGFPGEEMWVWLRLKLLADIGLVGLPNAGKSTLLSVVSNARPKIGDYPFTTLEPKLGTVECGDDTFVVADIPGLIEGAHEGIGLGDRFLGHVERCAALLHLVDATQENVSGAYRTVRNELEAYGHGLNDKTEIVCLNKIDAIDDSLIEDRVRELHTETGCQVHRISSVAGSNLDDLRRVLVQLVRDARAARSPDG